MKYYTANQAAKALKVHPRTIYRWGREKRIKTIRFGRTVRFGIKEGANDGDKANRGQQNL